MFPWYLPVFFGAVAAAVLGGSGLTLALTGNFGQAVGPPPAPARTTPRPTGYDMVALGDSISAGTGDTRAGGYPGRLARMLRERGRRATVANLAVPGAETGDVLKRLENPQVRQAVARASLILASAGGNDLTHTLRPELGAPVVEMETAAARARANLDKLVTKLRQLNAEAPIRLIGVYNPFEVVPAEAAEARGQLSVWNRLIEDASHGDGRTLAVPIADLFIDRPDRLAADRYHPGARGHELIAERILQTLPDGDDRPD